MKQGPAGLAEVSQLGLVLAACGVAAAQQVPAPPRRQRSAWVAVKPIEPPGTPLRRRRRPRA